MTSPQGVRTFDVGDRALDELLARKGSRRISVCIPCRDEAATIGPIVAAMRAELVDDCGLVDELIVLDDRSTDDTAAVARRAGATVVDIETVHAVHGVGNGKGNALWATLAASTGDYIAWCDGDVTSAEPSWVIRLLTPLLEDTGVNLVKALYRRPTAGGGGGRTTELVARPLLSLYFPQLAGLDQPLSGEFAGRRSALEMIGFVEGWGAEIAMLIDLARRDGAACIGQVDLGERRHRHRSLHELSVQAAEVMATLLARAEEAPSFVSDGALALSRADGTVVSLNLAERPPLAAVTAGGR